MPDLLECLTALYPTVEAVGRIAVKAGIPKRFVDLNGEANRFCSSLIEQARLRNRIERLIEAASGEYPERSEDLRAAQQEYLLHNQDLESIRDAKQGLVSLADLLREPELRVQVIEFRVWFVNVSGQIEVLRCYKALHDELHLLEYHCYNFVIQEVRRVADLRRRRLPDHPDPNELAAELRDCVRWDQIDQPEIELRGISHRLRQTVASRRLPPSETAWVEELTPALTDLSEVLKLHDLARLDRVGGALSRVIRIRPAQVNSRLFRAAIDVHLEGLVETDRKSVV